MSFSERLDRRRFLSLTGATGAAALVGGTGTVGAQSESDRPDGVADARHVSYTNQSPSDLQWNVSNLTGAPQIEHQALFDPFAKYNFARGEYEPYAIADWALDEEAETFELRLREGLTWSNGDPVTAEDVATQLRLGVLTGRSFGDYTESIDAPNDRTVVMNLSGTVNPSVVEFDVMEQWVQQPASVFGEYVDLIEAEGEDAARQELTSFEWSDPIASGPWAVDTAGEQEIVLDRRDDHPDSENVNFSQFAFRYVDGNQATQQALLSLELDSVFALFTPPRIVDQFPDAVQEETIPSKWGMGLIPNHAEDEPTSDRAVRQAIAYVVDRQQVVENAGPRTKQAPEIATGVASDDQVRWLGDAADDFETYGKSESQTEKATQILEDAGYEKADGTWQDSDGEPVELPIIVPTGWTDWETAVETIVDQLSAFGFEAEKDARSFATLLGSVWPDGNFTLSAGGWLDGSPQGAYPYFSLHNVLVENFRGFQYNYPAAKATRGGSEADVSVPAMAGDGELTVNPSDRIAELSRATDEGTIEEIVREQAWVANRDLPMIPVVEKLEQTFLTTDEWDVPEQGAEVSQVRWAPTWLPRKGEMQYTGRDPEPTVSLDFQPDEPRVDETVTATVSISGVTDGAATFSLEAVLSNPSVATVESVGFADDVVGDPTATVADDRAAVSLEGAAEVAPFDPTPVATVTLRATGAGSTEVSVDVASLANESGETFDIDAPSPLLTVAACGVGPIDGRCPTDPDLDGRYEDVNGNEELDFGDVTAFFDYQDDPAVTGNPDAFDFNHNGEVDFGDVVALFDEI